ncbi:E1 ubiquitin-activating enzyme [Malassezia vespertilionis]|uniref:Ubiquitin-activating enzyme E1-like n=1 Tax=Malassezia vespertilionis TaxID=2020962 RepID=A0A2N1JCT9_9BASI|nr:E1 ubiquitin-activating enzyme [Malassezia vespertilionis]PKI84359.1 Uba2p [Malassezia vespertilionis]WFD06369.1 E1 ubiquitin-activating enzyme [Malassezia vespertilionis]
MSSDEGRYAMARAVLGDAFAQVRNARMLIIGAGGIGSEVLKDLVCVGVGHLEIIDLDTIDLSNLNRQFLFQKKHIGKPKATVAKTTASAFNPDVEIVAHHANVRDPRFHVRFFQTFDVVLGALDNLETRRWVNKMCVAAQVPLVESGTAGYLGQVQPIRAGFTECYDCTAHPTPTTYPVCTIRSTPSTPVHCIVWAKNWFFPQLFGKCDDDDAELDEAEEAGENAKELANLRREARQMRGMRKDMLAGDRAAIGHVFDKLYDVDIRRLLSMDEMWERRTKPAPLCWRDALHTSGEEASSTGLRDRQELSIAKNTRVFLDTAQVLAARAKNAPLSFDKDDEDALALVTAAANLRAHVYHIPQLTQFEAKQVAGNIIPAIATTNAIVSGMAVVQALHMLAQRWDKMRVASLARNTARVFTTFAPAPPNPGCGVCGEMYLRASANVDKTTLQDVLRVVRKPTSEGGLAYDEDAEISVANGARILYDMDLDDNVEKTLGTLRIEPGASLAVVDEDGYQVTVQLLIEHDDAMDGFVVHWRGAPAAVPRRKQIPPPPTESDEEVEEIAPPAQGTKRRATRAPDGSAKRGAPCDDAPRKRTATGNTDMPIVLD